MTVFDVGRHRAVIDQAIQGYDYAVASYRQTVLTASQQVEDNLAALRILELEATVQNVRYKRRKARWISRMSVMRAEQQAISR